MSERLFITIADFSQESARQAGLIDASFILFPNHQVICQFSKSFSLAGSSFSRYFPMIVLTISPQNLAGVLDYGLSRYSYVLSTGDRECGEFTQMTLLHGDGEADPHIWGERFLFFKNSWESKKNNSQLF